MRRFRISNLATIELLGDEALVHVASSEQMLRFRGEHVRALKAIMDGETRGLRRQIVRDLENLNVVEAFGSSQIDRRTLIQSGAAVGGGAIIALAMPNLAAAASPSPDPEDPEPPVEISGYYSETPAFGMFPASLTFFLFNPFADTPFDLFEDTLGDELEWNGSEPRPVNAPGNLVFTGTGATGEFLPFAWVSSYPTVNTDSDDISWGGTTPDGFLPEPGISGTFSWNGINYVVTFQPLSEF